MIQITFHSLSWVKPTRHNIGEHDEGSRLTMHRRIPQGFDHH